jgi:hypothetical protein
VDALEPASTTKPCGSEPARESVHPVNAVSDWCAAFASRLAPTLVLRRSFNRDQLLNLSARAASAPVKTVGASLLAKASVQSMQ